MSAAIKFTDDLCVMNSTAKCEVVEFSQKTFNTKEAAPVAFLVPKNVTNAKGSIDAKLTLPQILLRVINDCDDSFHETGRCKAKTLN